MTETFVYVRILIGREAAAPAIYYQVREGSPAGPLLGSVTEQDGGWRASTVITGKLHLQWHADRETAARWLQTVAPKHGRSVK